MFWDSEKPDLDAAGPQPILGPVPGEVSSGVVHQADTSVISDARADAEAKDVPHDYVTDSLGRRYPVDKFGFRVRKSRRPEGFPPEEWNTLNNAAQKKVLRDAGALPALPVTSLDMTWGQSAEDVKELQMDYDSWGDVYSPSTTKKNGGGDPRPSMQLWWLLRTPEACLK